MENRGVRRSPGAEDAIDQTANAENPRAQDRRDNQPPSLVDDPASIDPTKLIDLDRLPAILLANYPLLTERRDELLAGIERWVEAHTEPVPGTTGKTRVVVRDMGDCQDAKDFIEQIKKFAGDKGEVNVAREAVKRAPFEACKMIDTFFKRDVQEPVQRALATLFGAYEQFLIDEQRRIKREADEKIRLAQEEADRLAAQAARSGGNEELVNRAVEAEERAEDLAARSVPKVAVRGDLGGSGGLRKAWTYEVTSKMELLRAIVAGTVPDSYVTVNEGMLGPMIRNPNGPREIPGLRIFQASKAR